MYTLCTHPVPHVHPAPIGTPPRCTPEDAAETVWHALAAAVYGNPAAFRDGLVYSAAVAPSAHQGVLSTGHDLLLTAHHLQAVTALLKAAARYGSGGL